jgi:NADH dehydrogenase
MWKKHIVIAGCGFAGINAARRLMMRRASLGIRFQIILVDAKPFSEFLPMLPDVVGGWLGPERLRCDLAQFAVKNGFEFIHGRIRECDFKSRTIQLDGTMLSYEYAVLSTGSRTNFYGNEALERSCFKLDDVEDALSLRGQLLQKGSSSPEVNVVVVGGGYTGIEIATNADYLLSRRRIKHRVVIVEHSERVLSALPEWVRAEVEGNLSRLGVETVCKDALKACDGGEVLLESGRRIENAVCIWAAGVRPSPFVDEMALSKEASRIVVDEKMRPVDDPSCGAFVVGDAASFTDSGTGRPLRMAVNFSLGQGRVAADNIINCIEEKSLIAYQPEDLGFLVPMANGDAPGIAKGIRVHGRSGYLLHYLMCVLRAEWGNRAGILRDFFFRDRTSARAEKGG